MSSNAKVLKNTDDSEYQRVKRELTKHRPQCPMCNKPMVFHFNHLDESKQWRCSTYKETRCPGQRNVSRAYLELRLKEASYKK